jgi:hypothetical protein
MSKRHAIAKFQCLIAAGMLKLRLGRPSVVAVHLLIVLFVASCSQRPGAPRDVPTLPHLVRVVVPGLDLIGPEKASAAIAVATGGELAFTEGYDSLGRAITLVYTLGRVLLRAGQVGDGPAELRRGAALAIDEQGIVALDVARGRILFFSRSGGQPTTTGTIGSVYPVRLARDSIDVLRLATSQSPPKSWLLRVSVRTLGERRLLHQEIAGVPAFATAPERIVVGDPYTYRFHSYDANGLRVREWGRDLPQIFPHDTTVDRLVRDLAARGLSARGGREGLKATPERHYSSLSFDGSGRLWARGILRDGQAPFADIFSDTTFLGRLELPCQDVSARMSLNGSWLALLCLAPATDAGVQLRLFRIVERGPPR